MKTMFKIIGIIAVIVYICGEFSCRQEDVLTDNDVLSRYVIEGDIEIPSTTVPGDFISHTGYVLSFNNQTNCPNWVAWELTSKEATTKTFKRTDDFKGDPMVTKAHRVETNDYTRSGYDRGHMCPAADMEWSAAAMEECFYMTNICPQEGILNRQWWEHLEEACRRWAKNEESVYICCGPIFNSSAKPKYIGKNVRIQVPDGFFKVVLSLRRGNEKAIGFIYRNDASRQTMEDAVTTVDKVEEMTGYDFFYKLDDALESRLESQCNLRIWN